MIQFNHVSKSYEDGTKAVDSLHLEIKKGEFFVLIGPSGCGKTTTMKMINRLIETTEGSILIDGKDIQQYNINELRWDIGYVLQQIALFPHMTIAENIAVVPEMRQWSKKEIKARVDDLLHMVGLDPDIYRDRMPDELSGGQKQRVGVVRALAANPKIVLMDEPFSALDPLSREQLQKDIVQLQKKIQKTIVFVTHDMQEALSLGDRICIMKEGKVVQLDTPEGIIHNPKNEFVEEFIGNRGRTWYEGKSVADVLPLDESVQLEGQALSLHASLQEALVRVRDEEVVPVEENGQYIGALTSHHIVNYMVEQMKERG
ncbi:glycine betaine/L-proline transport ATP binding subunit [Bacillus cereus BAG1X2-3]|uniref:Quaternary amine transport ATP-binding protein n=1 Tax=Bacillus cereus TaxID=1396 RepID=A0A9X7HNY0_BACCE|nr:ABC transporter ATP-binding protein [Bacillus cereus]EOO27314.1 glycine betaine/L-proline transport ATP binding subunit [Bacillus cereus BAG1X1-1]EOO49562.1 glycine betaine/L-proline transport ATP binding subunit [Bacillus cereus BAG1X2-1]EOO51432.1 glycine betaine/L-proline transport ATP binding subunit [Bacillus cereus BAG1X2-2]EOO60232.1 glycine betaine/L-proline transport ATP binding subunit [Bacillus cereus BAG1X2-3]EOP06481.1 glycine betaine/L-proline transport ATP binding subunit [Ba